MVSQWRQRATRIRQHRRLVGALGVDNRNLTVLATTKKGWLSADDTTIAPVSAAATCIAGLPIAALRLATAFQGCQGNEFARSPEREGRS